MRKLVCILAVAFAAVALAPSAYAQQSTWTAKPVLKRLDAAPSGFSAINAGATAGDETALGGVAYVDRDGNAAMRIGVYLQMTTDGADSNEGLDGIAASHWTTATGSSTPLDIIGMDNMVGGVFFEGTGTGIRQSDIDTYIRGSGISWQSGLLTAAQATAAGGGVTANALTTSYTRVITEAGTRPRVAVTSVAALMPQQVRGVWCEPDSAATPANSCEVLLGIINLPLSGLPTGLNDFTVSWGQISSEAGTGEWKFTPSHRRATVNSVGPQPGDEVTYNICSGDACITDYVTFSAAAVSVDEGTSTGNSVDVTVDFAQNSALAADLVVPITLDTTNSTAARAAYMVNAIGSDGTTGAVLVDSSTAGTPVTFNVTIPATTGALATDAVTASTSFRVTTVPNGDDVPNASENTTVIFGFGTVPGVADGSRAIGGNPTATVTIVDDDGPDFTANLAIGTGPLEAIEGTASDNRLRVAVTVTPAAANGTTLEHPVEFTFTVTSASTPAATVTWDNTGTDNRDFDIEEYRQQDDNSNDVMRVTYDHTTGIGTVWLHGSVGTATTDLSFPVIAIDDSDGDVGESVLFAVTDGDVPAGRPGAGRTVTGGADLTVPITDDDSNTLVLSLASSAVVEGTAAPNPLVLTATVELSNQAGDTGDDPLTVTVSVADGSTATAGTGNDYTIGSGPFTLTIPADSADGFSTTVNIVDFVVLDDDVVEPLETVVFTATVTETDSDSDDVAGTFAVTSDTFNITDEADERAVLTVAAGAATVVEAAGNNATFTVSLDNAVEAAFTASWAVDFAASGVDVDADDFPTGSASGKLIFNNPAAGTAGEETITIPVRDDDLSEGAETIQLSLTIDGSDVTDSPESRITTAGTTADTGNEAGVDIEASDPLTVALSASDTTVNEGGVLVLTATVSGGVSTTDMAVPVRLQSAPTLGLKTAADNADVTEDLTTTSITILANATSGTLTLNIVKDTTEETADALFLEIQDPTGASGAATADTNANTVEVDITEFVNVSLALSVGGSPATSADEADSISITGTATFDGSYTVPAGGLDFTWAVVHGTTSDDDFVGTGTPGGTITFTAGAADTTTSQTFTITISNDTLSEAAETFNVTLAPPSGGPTDLKVGVGIDPGIEFTINANDPVTLTVTGSDRANEGTTATYTVTATGGETAQPMQIQINLAGSSTADEQDVQTSLPLSLEIPAGADPTGSEANPRMVTFDVVYVREPVQAQPEGEQNAIWGVSRVLTTGVNSPSSSWATVTTRVIDNLARVADVAANEGADLVFTVTIDDNTSGAGTIAWSLVFGATAVGNAVAGDVGTITVGTGGTVTGTSGTVGFDGSTYTAEVTIPLDDDTVSEPAETFTIELGAVTGALASAVGVGGETATATGTINASDPVTLTLTGPDGAEPNLVTEGDTVTYSVTGTGAESIVEPLTVEFTLATLDADTRADIAEGPSLPITITIPAGSNLVQTQSITFEANEDGDPEPETETFTFQLANASGGGATPVIGGTGVTTTVQNGGGTADFNGNGQVTADDGLLLFWVLQFESRIGDGSSASSGSAVLRAEDLNIGLTGGWQGEDADNPLTGDAALVDLIRHVREIVGTGYPDINGNGSVTADDGLLLFWVLQFESRIGDGSSASSGSDVLRAEDLNVGLTGGWQGEDADNPLTGDAALVDLIRHVRATYYDPFQSQ